MIEKNTQYFFPASMLAMILVNRQWCTEGCVISDYGDNAAKQSWDFSAGIKHVNIEHKRTLILTGCKQLCSILQQKWEYLAWLCSEKNRDVSLPHQKTSITEKHFKFGF